MIVKRICILSFFALISASPSRAQTLLQQLTTERMVTPLGIDEPHPAFSWQMRASRTGASQKEYRLLVRNSKGETCWDTHQVASGLSLNIPYQGKPLQATTRYNWQLTVWDERGIPATATSWFETGLMNPDPNLSAWSGAQWIGGTNDDLVLYSPYLSIYKLSYQQQLAPGSTRAGFVVGANDPRLMDANKNIYQLRSGKDQSYIKLELDITALNKDPGAKARFNVYRAGYAPGDDPARSLVSFEVSPAVINAGNKNSFHTIEVTGLIGKLLFSIDGHTNFADQSSDGSGISGGLTYAVVNPLGGDWNCITFGMLADIGFAVPAGQKAVFSDIEVRNHRKPGNLLFKEVFERGTYQGIFKGAGLIAKDNHYAMDGGPHGLMITADPSRNAAPLLRTEFKLKNQPVKQAQLYVTARGIYELYLNGKRVGNDYFNPGLTQYPKTHLYQTYDVTAMLHRNGNALGAMLGEGWWSGLLSYGVIWNHFGDRQSLLAKMVITYADGSTEVVTTQPGGWKYSNQGPVVYSSLDLGEIYDATREQALKGWASVGFDDRNWHGAVSVPLDGTAYRDETTGMDYSRMQLTGQIGNNAQVYQILTACSVKEVRPGVYVYDMGQNFTGVPRLTFNQGQAGRKVILRASEMLYPALSESGKNVGMVMMENYRAALCTDQYTMRDGMQVYQPHFTFRGYRYLEVSGLDQRLPLAAVQGVVISSVQRLTADYQSSNAKVNKLWSNLCWSNIDNFLSIPSDCPQRNERMGWSGDLNVFSGTATYLSDAGQFLKRHMYAMRDIQPDNGRFTDIAPVGGGFGGILWGSAGIVVPWQAYLQYNDRQLLEQNYQAMAHYLAYIQITINPETGLSSDAALGDWLGPQNRMLGQAFLVTAYHIYDLEIMSRVARILGKTEDAAKFENQITQRKDFFNRKFVNANHQTLGYTIAAQGMPLSWQLADTQSSYAVGLALGAFSPENTPYMVQNLAEAVKRQNKDDNGVLRPAYALMTGFIGTAWINKALSDHGYNDISYRLLQNEQFPSWLYTVNQGATTIWERLNGYTLDNGFGGNNRMNSFNHYSFGAVGQWLMAYSLGIQRDEDNPGFKHFILQPQYDPNRQMTWAGGHYDSPYGRISSRWKTSGHTLTYEATIPANTSATLYLPNPGRQAVEKKTGLRFVRFDQGKAIYSLSAGHYVFSTTIP